jgi:peptide/nickel transport system substrate-binding protein
VTPVGTGPFVVSNNWQQDGELLLTPNPIAWPVPPYLDGLIWRFFPDEEALLTAYAAGEVDAVSKLTPTAVPSALVLPGMRLYTTPRPRYAQLLFNMGANGHPALRSRNLRTGLTQAVNKRALIDASLNGQGLPFEGPYLPQSFAYNPNLPLPLPYNPVSATQRFEAEGWLSTDGSAVRRGGEEGDIPLGLTLLAFDTPSNRAIVEALTEQWGDVGVELYWSLTDDLSTFYATLEDGSFDVALVDITATGDPDLYDFWSQEAIVDGQNYAGWNRRRASEALEAARQVWNQDERRAYYEAFLTFFDEDRPAVTLFQYVDNYGINEIVQAVDVGQVQNPRDRYTDFAEWYLPLAADTAVCD